MYLIYSTLSKNPFIDETRCAYVFRKREDADAFVSEVRCTEVFVTESGIGTHLFSECFAAGAQVLKERVGNGMEIKHDLYEEPHEKRFYNELLNANITRYLHTHNRSYLRDLRNCSFIVPVRITNEPYTKIVYATIYKNRREQKKYAFLAFTDLSEYDKWTEKDNNWKPLLVDSEIMQRIGKKHGFVLDIYRTAFYITTKIITRYMREEEGDET